MKITGLKRRKNNKNVTSKVSSEEKAIGEKNVIAQHRNESQQK